MHTEVMVVEKKKSWWQGPVLLFLIISSFFVIILFRDENGLFQSWIRHTSHGIVADEHDELLGGLLSPNFDNPSCLSRYKSSIYRQLSPFRVSSYLIEKLRNYEEYHMRCGPKTENYRKAVDQLKSGKNFEHSDCQYTIWLSDAGLGNRMLSLVSTFLFSLLTNRVLLLDITHEMQELFCEPFPESSWVLPSDFPINDFKRFRINASDSYSFMVENKIINNNINVSAESLPQYVYLHLVNNGLRLVNHIFCENDQRVIQKINWTIVRADSYFSVALFFVPMYEKELGDMFPDKESVFHHLGRYLFHPANPVWENIERYYKNYLQNADERVALQVRVFPYPPPEPFENMFGRVLDCLRMMNLLPDQLSINNTRFNQEKRVILVISLFSQYYEKIKSMYVHNSTVTRENVLVYQPSHEMKQKSYELLHNQQALAEIFLLSYCDKMVTTSWSTFGYVGHNLAGKKPWIVRTPGWIKFDLKPTCIRPESVEPCLHSRPILKCDGNKDLNAAELLPFVRHCEDVPTGVKLFSEGTMQ